MTSMLSFPIIEWHSWTSSTGRSTGILEITTTDKRIWSIPSLWGCPIGCTFCISSSQAYGGPISAMNLRALLDYARAQSKGTQPVELSFTGEGEAVLNVDNVQALVEHVSTWQEIKFARVCVSGLKMNRAHELANFPWPTRLQCSLHSAVQSTRSKLVVKSLDLAALRVQLLELASRFVSVDLNVVLQHGVNDCDAHLSALLTFVSNTPWRVVFNPHMQEGAAVAHHKRDVWINALQAEGTSAVGYHTIGSRIVEQSMYRKLTFVRSVVPLSADAHK